MNSFVREFVTLLSSFYLIWKYNSDHFVSQAVMLQAQKPTPDLLSSLPKIKWSCQFDMEPALVLHLRLFQHQGSHLMLEIDCAMAQGMENKNWFSLLRLTKWIS